MNWFTVSGSFEIVQTDFCVIYLLEMRGHRYTVILLLFCVFCFQGQTVREQAGVRFSGIEWLSDPDPGLQSSVAVRTIGGGNETFSVLKTSEGKTLKTVYPRIGQLGLLDYSEADPVMVTFLRAVSQSIVRREVTAELCLEEQPYLPVVGTYRLSQYPMPGNVYFGTPFPLSDDAWRVTYMIVFDKNEHLPLYLDVTIKNIDRGYTIADIVFKKSQ